jgi:hypothetical protein
MRARVIRELIDEIRALRDELDVAQSRRQIGERTTLETRPRRFAVGSRLGGCRDRLAGGKVTYGADERTHQRKMQRQPPSCVVRYRPRDGRGEKKACHGHHRRSCLPLCVCHARRRRTHPGRSVDLHQDLV